MISLYPHKRYIRILDHYVPSAKGEYAIYGRFPNFKNHQGAVVYMDYDRTFWNDRVDFYTRAGEYRRQQRKGSVTP